MEHHAAFSCGRIAWQGHAHWCSTRVAGKPKRIQGQKSPSGASPLISLKLVPEWPSLGTRIGNSLSFCGK